MDRLKKRNPLYLWFMRQKNKVMDVSLESSDNINKGNDPNEPSVSCDRTRTTRERIKEFLLCRNKKALIAFSVSSSQNVNNSSDQNELTSVTTEEVISESTTLSELTAVSSEGPSNADMALSELTAVSSEGLSKTDAASSELTIGTHYGNLSYDSHLVEEVTCVRPLSESIMEQLSKLDDGEDVDLNSYDFKIKRLVYLIVSSVMYRIFGMLLVFADVSLIITALLVTDSTMHIPLAYHLISLSIALFFLMDVLLQIFVERIQLYFSDTLNFLDAFVIVVTLLVNIIYIFYDFGFLKDIPRLTILFRLIILIRIFHLAYQKRRLEMLTRRMVSGNKRRYKKGGFDLDLTYVTERIIAMSFPSSGKQSFYRNPIKEVVRFLDTKHENHYQVYNLCSERSYDPKYFHHRVHRIMIDDHNVPSLSEMLEFSKEVNKWMAQDDENVVAIHCKGGKGRTGTMVCVCLIVSEIFKTAEDSLYYFGERRTDKTSSTKFQGVETPSQNRYVGYFADVKNIYNLTLPPRKILTIKKIIIYSIHGVGKGNGSDLKVRIIIKHKVVFSGSASKNCRIVHDVEADRVIIYLVNCPLLHDDVKIQFFSPELRKYYDNCPFFFWFNTSFIQNNRLYLPRNELDNPHKPKAWKIYRPEFAVELYFEEVIL